MFDITVVIQGPLSPISLDYIDEYREYGEVVVSCWEDDALLHLLDDRVLTVMKPIVPKEYYVNHPSKTFSYQVHSIYNGLCAVQTPFVVRVRSDERYNLAPLIEQFRQAPDKIVCGNIFFRPWGYHSFHIGDHLFAGQTSILLCAYQLLIQDVEKYNNMACAEQSLTMAILDTYERDRTREEFVRTFDVIDINLLRPFVARWQLAGCVYENHFPLGGVITTMEEL